MSHDRGAAQLSLERRNRPHAGRGAVLRATPARVTRGGPVLGEHNNEISGGLVGPVRLRDLRQHAIV